LAAKTLDLNQSYPIFLVSSQLSHGKMFFKILDGCT
jgi:hypothetical protein